MLDVFLVNEEIWEHVRERLYVAVVDQREKANNTREFL